MSAFNSCRLLEKELQRLQKVSEIRQSDLTRQIEELKQDNEKQLKLNGQVLICISVNCKCILRLNKFAIRFAIAFS